MCPSCLQIRSLDEFILYMAGGLRKLVFVDICLFCLGKKKSGKSQPHGYCREMKIVMEQNNRAKRSGLVADLTLEQWLEFLENAQVCCIYCQKDVGREHLALDHIIQ